MARTMLAAVLLVGAIPAIADYTFPPFDVAVTDEFTTIVLDTSAVPVKPFAGFRVELTLTGYFSDIQDPIWRLRTDGLPIPLADPGPLPYPWGRRSRAPLPWEGAFPVYYHGGEPLYFDARTMVAGSAFNFTDITITLVSGRLASPVPPDALDWGSVSGDGVGVSTSLDSNGVRWFKFVTQAVQAADCDILRIDTLDSHLSGGAYAGGNDPELALYNRRGMLLATSDDIDQLGGSLQAMLAFGVNEGAPVVSLGDLPAGAYFLAVAGFNAEFGQRDFKVITDSSVQGTLSLNLRRGVPAVDCNGNSQADACDIALLASDDVNTNGVPDECEDCNGNSVLDDDDLATVSSRDCNRNAIPDECDLAAGTADDCNTNGVPDACDLISPPHNCCEAANSEFPRSGCSDANIQDCVFWLMPECAGAIGNWTAECVELVESGACGWCERSADVNSNGIPDECDAQPRPPFVRVRPRR